MEDMDNSDHASFLDPVSTTSLVWSNWHRYVDTSDALAVPDSVMATSHPLTIIESIGGEYGRIHTSLDVPDRDPAWINSTTHEEQTKVVANVVAYLALEDVSNRVPQHIDPYLVTAIGLSISGAILLVLYKMIKKQKKEE
jgi:hypothetical protein